MTDPRVVTLIAVAASLAAIWIVMCIEAARHREPEDYDKENPYLTPGGGKASPRQPGRYERRVKRILDKLLSFIALIVLSPVFLIISLAILIDDPGPVFFTQRRVGKDKEFFALHKFRSMNREAPHDVPTHMLIEPERHITRVGRFLRRTSLDELPQIWDIFRGRMSLVGPRPALWNQDDLVRERDKYGANDVLPGLTGWAQINGRDRLEITVKSKLDGDYVAKLNKGGWTAFGMDLRCTFGTFFSVLRSEDVIEGRVNGLISDEDAGFAEYGHKKHYEVNREIRRRVLIAGAGSFVGTSFSMYAAEHFPNLIIETIDMKSDAWRQRSFSGFHTVLHVAGIAHADVDHITEEEQARYYAINTDLAVECAKKAKEDGVKQFIFMSSMIIYGNAAPLGKEKYIDENTVPLPSNFYGESKWRADKGVRRLASEEFHVAVLRPPMIYGRGSKGNYPTLSKIARKTTLFPRVENRRSMLFVDNLSEFLGLLITCGEGGIFFPQNADYVSTEHLVREIGITVGKPVYSVKVLNFGAVLASHMHGHIGKMASKAFGNFTYDMKLSQYDGLPYQVGDLRESIIRTEIET